ncbi:Lrp/AsnC family transcriptional regulator [Novosphingobium panipatense]|jgi:Lrp/AsnC family transcriptional regulator for asnA, asnC and gidA|uniref:Lrp/AsnC family transcriptional regulator, regulator for asnA, asnC and gidA n=1 Tax=Novosphingobium panipatense TaxID=428991 RepID=A0ABY1Q9A2_9SPHN|nr:MULTISPECIES: Lrp/AsnC family transcriptional regulator [Novosphingobium]SMP60895.1 Lrp/AsnC family transcriptional regulator, regulator for asnA, asnC and gidA [Novosphingobium panipatense]
MSTPNLDDLDRQMIEILSRDARVSNRKIAAELGVTEGTVRGRIKRLQQDRLISFTAITDFGMANASNIAFIGVQASVEHVRDVARQIAELPDVNAVIITMGQFNIFVIALFDGLESLWAVASDKILAMPHVHHVETSIGVNTVKYNARVVRITESDQDF